MAGIVSRAGGDRQGEPVQQGRRSVSTMGAASGGGNEGDQRGARRCSGPHRGERVSGRHARSHRGRLGAPPPRGRSRLPPGRGRSPPEARAITPDQASGTHLGARLIDATFPLRWQG